MSLSLSLSLLLLVAQEPAPVEQAPVEETLVEPAPVEETVVTETPTEETIVAETVVLEIPELAVDTSQLSEELFAHPGLFSGDYDQVRNDWLAALRADRASPLAAYAARRISGLDQYCTTGVDPFVLAELIEGVDDGEASFAIKRLYMRELRRSRFADVRPVFQDDLFDDWFTHWRVLMPWGPLGAPTPMRTLVDPPDPRSAEVVDPDNGVTRRWRSLERLANRTLISPDQYAHLEAGTSYAALWVRADIEVGRLELHSSEAFRAWWNGMPTFEDLHTGLTTANTIHRGLVNVQPGWNLLLVEFPTGEGMRLGGRLLDRSGRIVPFHEWEDLATSPNLPEIPMPAEVLDVSPWMPTGLDAYALMVKSSMLSLADHNDQALALAKPSEMDPATEAAWLQTRYTATTRGNHLPTAVRRSRLMAMEQEMTDLGFFAMDMQLAAARRLLQEDKIQDALAAARSLGSEYPHCLPARLLEAEVLMEIDDTGTLAKPLLTTLHADFPEVLQPIDMLQDIASDRDDRGTELRLARLSVAAAGERGSSLLPLLLEGTEADRDEAARMIEILLTEEPEQSTGIFYRNRLWRVENNHAALLADYARRVAEQPARPNPLVRLGIEHLAQDDPATALRHLQAALELDPGDEELRSLLTRLSGQADPAEVFFTAFAPDAEAQLARREEMKGDTSTAMLLDSGMVYFLPDGTYIYRTDNLDLALDRRGTEILHELPVAGKPLLAQVHGKDGNLLEPHQVDDSWVLPSLDPGDVIATSFVRQSRGLPGLAPNPGNWRFASLEEGFALSRWVLFIPDGLPGRLIEHGFDGSHEILDWEGGKVHIFERHDSARVEPEVLMPSQNEILPWVAYGEDAPQSWEAEDWRRWFLWQTSLPADIELELRDFLATLDLSGDSMTQARAIYAAVDEHVLQYGGGGDVTDVWTLKRGDPTYFLSALFTLADIPHEWALLQDAAPELQDDPDKPFDDGGSYTTPALRLTTMEEGSTPSWLVVQTRGTGFGSLPAQMLGADALVLEPEGFRIETISRDGLEDIWDLDLSIAYTIQPNESALVEGKVAITGAQGEALREQLAQISPQQRDQAVRQITAQLVKGLDLTSSKIVDLEKAGASLQLNFFGSIPDYVQHSGEKYGARLRLPELGLADGLGAAERELAFAFRDTLRVRVHAQLDTNEAWILEYGPSNAHQEMEGFLYDFRVASDEFHLSVDRVLTMRGLVVEAEDFPAFLETLREYENQASRAVRLSPNLPEPPPEMMEEILSEDGAVEETMEEAVPELLEEPLEPQPEQPDEPQR